MRSIFKRAPVTFFPASGKLSGVCTREHSTLWNLILYRFYTRWTYEYCLCSNRSLNWLSYCKLLTCSCVQYLIPVLQIFTENTNLVLSLYGRVLSHLLPYITGKFSVTYPLYYGKALSHLLPLYHAKVWSTFLDIRITLWILGSRIKNDLCTLSDCTRSTFLGLTVVGLRRLCRHNRHAKALSIMPA